MLEACPCEHAHAGYAVAGHDPCGDHEHPEKSDEPVPSDQYLSAGAASPSPAPAGAVVPVHAPEASGLVAVRGVARRSTGPPGAVRAALASTVLRF